MYPAPVKRRDEPEARAQCVPQVEKSERHRLTFVFCRGPAKAPSITTRSYTLRRHPALGGALTAMALVPTLVSLLPLLPRHLDRITKRILNIEHLDEHKQEDGERGSEHKAQAPEKHPKGDLRGNRQRRG